MSTLRKYLSVSDIASLSFIPSQTMSMNSDIFHLSEPKFLSKEGFLEISHIWQVVFWDSILNLVLECPSPGNSHLWREILLGLFRISAGCLHSGDCHLHIHTLSVEYLEDHTRKMQRLPPMLRKRISEGLHRNTKISCLYGCVFYPLTYYLQYLFILSVCSHLLLSPFVHECF